MSDRLTDANAWNRARAVKLHEHFQTVALAVKRGATIKGELARVQRLIDGMPLSFQGGEMILQVSCKTLRREWDYWNKGGREGREQAAWRCKPEALLCTYKPGCGGHRAMPRKLVQELQRRMTLTTGGRDKHGKSPISQAWDSLRKDFAAQRPLPGVDYDLYPPGAEFPWSYSTICRHKAPRSLRALGNRGASAHKAASAYVSLNYAKLRKGELYTLDDVRLDVVCIDEATGKAIEVVIYVFMEVGSRMIVGYVMKPAAAIQQEDVDELLAHMLQTPGFGIGVGYATHILFERGATACSDAAKALIEGVLEGQVKIHRTGMIGGVRWIGAPKDKARGNAAGKAVIESFNRSLHYSLLHLPGQRGNLFGNQPENMGDLNQAGYHEKNSQRRNKGTLIDEAEQLAQFQILTGHRCKLKLPMLYLWQLNEAVREAIKRHNTEPGHEYRGHGKHWQAEVAPGVWRADDTFSEASLAESADAPRSGVELAPTGPDNRGTSGNDILVRVQGDARFTTPDIEGNGRDSAQLPSGSTGKKTYTLHGATSSVATISAREVGIYWAAWGKLVKVRPDLDRHEVTRATLGANIPHKKLTRPQWAQLLSAFRSLAHQARTTRS